MACKLTPEIIRDVLRMSSEGFTPKQIASRLDISRKSVYRIKAGEITQPVVWCEACTAMVVMPCPMCELRRQLAAEHRVLQLFLDRASGVRATCRG